MALVSSGWTVLKHCPWHLFWGTSQGFTVRYQPRKACMALCDTEPLNTRHGPISALFCLFCFFADGAKDKESLESEDMDTRPEPENREMHVGYEWSIESFCLCWFENTQVGTGRLLLEMHVHHIYICTMHHMLLLRIFVPYLYSYIIYYSEFRREMWASILGLLGAPSSMSMPCHIYIQWIVWRDRVESE